MIRLVILGQPCSKSNRSQIVRLGDRASIGKSADAKRYIRDALRQIPPAARQRLAVPVRMTLRLWYASERPDMDESQILDVLQDQWKRDKATGQRVLVQAGVYRDDRLVRERHTYHAIDRANPRAEIEIEPMQPQQAELPMLERETEDLWSRPSRPSLDASSAYSSMLLSMLVRTNKR